MNEAKPDVSRRALLVTAGGLGLTGLLAACTPTRSAPNSASPSTLSTTAGSITPSGTASPSGTVSTSGSGPSGRPTFASLSRQLSAPLLQPGNRAYPAAARLYNPRFDASAKPAAIAQVRSAADVAACVRFATAASVPLALRSGGHSYGGWSSGSGLVIDVSALSTVQIDRATGTARIGAGARLGAVYTALGAKGFALAAGSCPSVGITGLASGGGVGVLARAFGLTCDAVQSVQLVTADGHSREVSRSSQPDLFWALRGGGGGSFGAVTAFTVALRPAPRVHTFYLEWDFGHAEQVLSSWQRWLSRIDDKLWTTCKLLADPASGRLRATVSGTWIGLRSTLTGQLTPLLTSIGARTTVNQLESLDYPSAMLLEAGCSGETAAQCLAGALTPAKRQPFAATSAVLNTPLPAAGVRAAVAGVRSGMNVSRMVEGGVSFDALGGAVARAAPADTAFVHRNALALIQYTATWASMTGRTGSSAAPFDTFVRRQRADLVQWTGTSAYSNYADAAITDYGSAYWGSNYPRLQGIKKQYDPGNLFTFAQAVRP